MREGGLCAGQCNLVAEGDGSNIVESDFTIARCTHTMEAVIAEVDGANECGLGGRRYTRGPRCVPESAHVDHVRKRRLEVQACLFDYVHLDQKDTF